MTSLSRMSGLLGLVAGLGVFTPAAEAQVYVMPSRTVVVPAQATIVRPTTVYSERTVYQPTTVYRPTTVYSPTTTYIEGPVRAVYAPTAVETRVLSPAVVETQAAYVVPSAVTYVPAPPARFRRNRIVFPRTVIRPY